MRTFVRGTTAYFSTTFYDENGDVATPDEATLTIRYPEEGYPLYGNMATVDAITMTTDDDGAFIANWSTAVSGPGIVYWHARTDNAALAGEDGQFLITGNLANLEVEAD